TFGHRFEFSPADLRATDTWAESTIGASHDVFAAENFCVAHQPIGDRLCTLHDVGGMADHAGHEDFARWQFDLFPDTPFVLMTGIGRFNGNRVGFDLENEIDDVAQRDVVFV